MIGRGLCLLTVLSSCVLSLPVTSSQQENVDVEVMKCIVEALADVLSRPHLMPVSQECLITLKTDDRLVAILRHHNFLRELQDIAFQGDQERAKLQGDPDVAALTTQSPQTTDDSGDQSMLQALGGPGERSILFQRKRTQNGSAEKDDSREGSQEDGESVEVQVKRGKDEEQDEVEKREEEEHNDNSEELSKEKKTIHKKDDGLGEERDASRNESKQMESEEENEEETMKKSPLSSQKRKEEEGEVEGSERGSRESLKQWTKRTKMLHLKKKAVGKETQQLASQREVPHHSKEVMVEEMEEERKKKRGVQRSPEEKELQMIARRVPEERRGMEEEGSASRKSEEPEIESLAAIESELENVAQKLHELRRG